MKTLYTTIIVLLTMASLNAQNPSYNTLWNEVEKLELADTPKSALEIVTQIETKAKAENNQAQHIKTLLFKSKFALILEENAQLSVVEDFKSMIEKSEAPTKNVLQNMLAKLYWDYFQQNRYQFYERTKTENKVDDTDFRTWDLETLFAEISTYYQQSLENEKILQNTTTQIFEPILTNFKSSITLRPTLYDFLTHNALEFYKTSENAITKPTYAFEISEASYLGDARAFQQVKLTSKDSTSLELKALQIYQNLIAFHAAKNNYVPLASVDVERLAFVYTNGRITDKEAVYLSALQSGKNKVEDLYAKAIYDFEIAKHTYNQGQNYTAGASASHRWANKEVLEICERLLKEFPDTYLASEAQNLKEAITAPSLQLQLESYLSIASDSRMLVTYRNTPSVQLSVYQISAKESDALQEIYDKEKKRNFIDKLPLEKQWTQQLRDEGDYRNHSTEILLPGFPQGRYLILASPPNDDNKRLFEHVEIQYTNLAIVKTQENANTFFQVVDRNNGQPIANAKCEVKDDRRNYSSKNYVTDAKGFIKVPNTNDNYYNYSITVSKADDTAEFTNYYNYNSYYNRDTNPYRSFLFTDRSIYRPGQIVYFKGIATEMVNKKSSVLPNQKVSVVLFDANYEKVSTLELITNDFGTVAGEFVVPNGVLTGQFHLTMNAGDSKRLTSEVYFRVEEYKRPKFETNFKPVTETYRVNDDITVKGEAISFSGSNITNAKVVYKVTRKVQYPRWYYWRGPQNYGEGQEITFGETTTNNKGEYEIDFKALPDGSVDKTGQPVFQYEVSADVTDINGETQSTTTIVNVGYHALTIDLQAPKRLDKQDKDQTLKLSTKNLNGEKVPAEVTVTMYKLKAPESVLRKRPWNAPDYQEYSEAQFKKLFPHDPYNNEDDVKTWEQGEQVFSKTVNTDKIDEVELGNLKRWASGAYIIIAKTTDKFGQEVLAKHYTALFSDKDETPADNQLFEILFDQETYKTGDQVFVTVKSNAAITVTLSVEKKKQISETFVIALDNNSKTISVPVTGDDVGGFAIHYSLTAFNSFEGDSKLIQVPAPKTELTIETNTFRDKLEPGVPETWSFIIKGPDGEKVSAELLASMYDASLDQFTPHQWQFNPQPSLQYRSLGSPDANNSFGSRALALQYNYRTNYNQKTQHFDQYNWFGFTIAGQTWKYNSYLNNLRKRVKDSYSAQVEAGTIIGFVYDQNGLPLPGVNVLLKGEDDKRDTQTDFDGKFSMKAEPEEELIFSYVGFRTINFILKKNNVIEIYMREDSEALDEVIVTGYGIPREKKALGYAVSTIETESVENAPEGDVEELLNSRVPGVAVNDSINKQQALDFDNVKIRKNLQETAFFFPQLRTDADGNISFNFTTPEALTRWKLQLLAHTKELDTKVSTFETVTQKELMVVPNAPRFLREGDEIIISSKISNLSDTNLSGQAVLQLNDAVTGESIDIALGNRNAVKDFSVEKSNNTQVSWRLQIPSTVQAVEYKVIAKTDNFSDGEQNTLPVLSNRMLVTETLPMWVRSNQTKTFTLDKLKNNTSTTLKHHKLTLEVTSNPAWYAVQALPYLMEFPYECNEQTFARYYANSLATHIANSNPRIKAVFDQWANSDALLSNLEKNEELKSLLIQETPWLRDAQSETEQKKRIALLFDLNLMQRKQGEAANKLRQNQLGSGAWPWFNGGYASRYITQHIVTGFGHLDKLGVTTDEGETDRIIKNAISYLDAEFVKEYKELSKYTEKPDYKKDHLSRMQTQYLYMRSFFPELKKSKEVEEISNYYVGQMETYWNTRDLYSKGMIALVLHRNGNTTTALKITKALKENSITSEELGMYWKSNTPSWYWYQAPVETQALMVEVFSEIDPDIHREDNTVDNLKVWLLKNKQTNQWPTTKATTEAVYALLLKGTDWLSVTEAVQVTVGNTVIDPSKLDNVKVEAGTGYFKTSWNATEISESQATVTMQKKGEGIAWGGLYWQYFEDLDKITSAETPLQLKKKLFLKTNTATGEELSEIKEATALKVGDLVRVRIELRVDRDMDFVHMKDMRAAGLEPIDVLSTYKWQDGLGYYQATKDASTNFFFDTLRKGIYVFEYDLRVNNAGTFSNGITTIQSMYAPEFTSHSEGVRIMVEE
ncbi:MG2 domain-containing protein [Rasiella sp. SM2506]|uniref:alpha-2-macroglobulin family protein n=1 Tax=Rasiella sp. SM2506 TaxID=3423914 RepID=UPI003D7B5FA4